MIRKGATIVVRGENRATAAMRGVVSDVDRVGAATRRVSQASREMSRTNVSMMRGMSANRRIVQQFGFQITDFTTQIAGGQSALLAFVQQGGQLLQFFGATGAVLATLLTVFGTASLIFLRSGQSLATLTPILGVLHDEFRWLADTVRWVGSRMADFANLIVNNFDTVVVSATLLAGFFAVRWVVSLMNARVAAFMLATENVRLAATSAIATTASREFAAVMWIATMNLNVFRAAIVAVVAQVAAFAMAGVTAVSTFTASLLTLRGAAMALYVIMGGPLIEAMARFAGTVVVTAGNALAGLYMAILRVTGVIITSFVSALTISTTSVRSFVAALTIANVRTVALTVSAAVLRAGMAAYAAMTSVAAIGQVAFNGAIMVGHASVIALSGAFRILTLAIAATGIGVLVIGLGMLITGFMRAKDAMGSWGAVLSTLKDAAVEIFDRIRMSFGMIPIAVRLGSAHMARWFLEKVQAMWNGFSNLVGGVAESFDELFGSDLSGRIAGIGNALSGITDGFSETARLAGAEMVELAGRIGAPIEALQRLFAAMRDNNAPVDVRDWFSGSAEAAGDAANRIRDLYSNTARTISDEFKQTWRGLIDGSKSATDVIKDMLTSVLNRIYDILMTPVFDNIARMVTGGIFRLTNTPMPATIPATFAGGGSTPRDVRAGGTDGLGGRYAIVHPNEKIIDETIAPRGQTRGTASVVTVQPIINNYSNEPVNQETRTGPNGETLLITTIGRAIADGKLDGALSSRFNTSRKVNTR